MVRVRSAWHQCLAAFCTVMVFSGAAGCIKYDVQLEERKGAIHYTDRFYDVSAADENNIWIVGFYGKVIHSTNGGQTWTNQESGTKDPLTGVELINSLEGWIISLTGKVLHTDNGGLTWTIQEMGDDLALMDIEFRGDTNGWIVGGDNTILRTADGGREWVPCDVPSETYEDESGGLIDTSESILNAVCFLDADNGWVVGEYGTVYCTTDSGNTWQKRNAGIPPGDYLFDVAFVDRQKGCAVAVGGRTFRTNNGGERWDVCPSCTENALYTIVANNGSLLAAGNRGTLLKSGSNWTQYGELPAVSWFRNMKFIDADTGWIVGGSGTILKTTNAGKQWMVVR